MKYSLSLLLALCVPLACAQFTTGEGCDEPKAPGLCKAYFPRYFFNTATGKCENFVYGGCGGNKNNFKELADCEAACVTCKQPKAEGLCLALFHRYFYNASAKKCEKFVYGGCGGNKNNFLSLSACKNTCMKS